MVRVQYIAMNNLLTRHAHVHSQFQPWSPPYFPFYYLLQLAVFTALLFPSPSDAIIDAALPPCAKPGFHLGLKSGAALGGIGSSVYTGLMATCPGMLPSITGAATTVALPGLMLAGPLAPLATMLTAGVLGGAVLGGTAGSIISCREVGAQNETHYMIQVQHPDGYMLEVDKGGSGKYRPLFGYNHHVHPRPHVQFDYSMVPAMHPPPPIKIKPSKQMYNFRDFSYGGPPTRYGAVVPNHQHSGYFSPSSPPVLPLSYFPGFHKYKYSLLPPYLRHGPPYHHSQTLRDTFTSPKPKYKKPKSNNGTLYLSDTFPKTNGGFVPIVNPANHLSNDDEDIPVASKDLHHNQYVKHVLYPPELLMDLLPPDPPPSKPSSEDEMMVLDRPMTSEADSEVKDLLRDNVERFFLRNHLQERKRLMHKINFRPHVIEQEEEDKLPEYAPPHRFIMGLPSLAQLQVRNRNHK